MDVYACFNNFFYLLLVGEKVVKKLIRIVLILWFMVVFILAQSYTASLSSMGTNIETVISKKGKVGYIKGSFVSGIVKQMNIDESRLVEYNSPEELHQLFSKGRRNGGIDAAILEIPYTKIFLNKYCTSKYTRVGPIYKANGFAFVSNLPLLK